METILLKLVVEKKDKQISTWTCVFNQPIADIVLDIRQKKQWIGGNFVSASLFCGDSDVIHIDIEKSELNVLLRPTQINCSCPSIHQI
jgi:hypothetical protein